MAYADRLDTDIDTFLKRHEQKELLRFVTLGSVDDGKSTLIGRLLHDVDCVYEDQLDDARQGTNEIDFALITDGLVAEREQGGGEACSNVRYPRRRGSGWADGGDPGL